MIFVSTALFHRLKYNVMEKEKNCSDNDAENISAESFDLIKLLGTGGCASVYLARDKLSNR